MSLKGPGSLQSSELNRMDTLNILLGINLTMMEMIAITQIHVKPSWKLLLTPPIIGCFDPVGPVNEES